MVTRNELTVLAMTSGFIALMFIPFSQGTLFIRELFNSGHVLVFFLLSLSLCYLLDRHKLASHSLNKYLYVLISCLIIGLLIEVLQSFTGRETSWDDMLRNVYGTAAGLVFAHARSRQGIARLAYSLVTVLIVIIGIAPIFPLSASYYQRNQVMPEVFSFNADWAKPFLVFQHARILPGETTGLSSVIFEAGKYPGIELLEPVPDWSQYKKLKVKVNSTNSNILDLQIRIHDLQHNNQYNDRFNKSLKVHTGLNEFEILFDDILNAPVHRQMDMKHIAGIVVFLANTETEIVLEIGNITLE